jgi:hypothetical protein
VPVGPLEAPVPLHLVARDAALVDVPFLRDDGRDETCPISTEGGTRRVQLVREGGTRRVQLVREEGRDVSS